MTRTAAIAQPLPRLLSTEQAAAYCGLSVPTFRRLCIIRPIRLGEGKRAPIRYDVRSLDEWIDRLNQPQSSSVLSPNEALERMRVQHGRAGSRERH